MRKLIIGALLGMVMAVPGAPRATAQDPLARQPWETDFEHSNRLGMIRGQAIRNYLDFLSIRSRAAGAPGRPVVGRRAQPVNSRNGSRPPQSRVRGRNGATGPFHRPLISR